MQSTFYADAPLRRYLARCARLPRLDREEEQRLAREWQATQDRDAQRLLTECNVRNVVPIASRYARYGLPLEDLVAEGTLGLLEAVRRFEPERNLRFMTYARYWIRAYIQEYVIKHARIVGFGTSPRQSRMFFRMEAERASLRVKRGDQDEDEVNEELAAVFDTSVDRVREMRGRLSHRDLSLDAPCYADGGVTWGELVRHDGKDPEQGAGDGEQADRVREVLDELWDQLDLRERLILDRRLMCSGKAMTLAELGRHLGISRERVRQIELALKDKLRDALLQVSGIH